SDIRALTTARLHLAIYFCLHRDRLPETTAEGQLRFGGRKISVKNCMSAKIGGRSGSGGLGLTLVNLGAAWEGTRCHGRFLLTQQEGNPTPGRPARPQGLS